MTLSHKGQASHFSEKKDLFFQILSTKFANLRQKKPLDPYLDSFHEYVPGKYQNIDSMLGLFEDPWMISSPKIAICPPSVISNSEYPA